MVAWTGDRFLVVGQPCDDHPGDSLEVECDADVIAAAFDPAGGRWEDVPSPAPLLPESAFRFAAVGYVGVADGRHYFDMGSQDVTERRALIQFDPAANTWSTVEELPEVVPDLCMVDDTVLRVVEDPDVSTTVVIHAGKAGESPTKRTVAAAAGNTLLAACQGGELVLYEVSAKPELRATVRWYDPSQGEFEDVGLPITAGAALASTVEVAGGRIFWPFHDRFAPIQIQTAGSETWTELVPRPVRDRVVLKPYGPGALVIATEFEPSLGYVRLSNG